MKIKLTKYIYQQLIMTYHQLVFLQKSMQSIQQELKVKCIGANDGVYVCNKPGCKNSAIMCETKSCECYKNQSQVREGFETKGRCILPILKQIYEWYDKQAKLINIEMEALKRMIDNKDVILAGKDKELYQLFVEGKAEQIIAGSVFTFLDSIQRDVDLPVKQKMEETKKQLEKEKVKFDGIIEDVKRLTQVLSRPTFPSVSIKDAKFTGDLCASNITVINNHTVKLTTYTGNDWAAFLSPSFLRNDFRSYRVKYRINQVTSNWLMFGVCQITPNLKVTDTNIYNLIQYGSFSYWNNHIYLGKAQDHTKENSNIAVYQTNDIVEVEYLSQTQRVSVKNLTKNTQSISQIKTDDTLPIYFAVILAYINDQVSVIDIQYKI